MQRYYNTISVVYKRGHMMVSMSLGFRCICVTSVLLMLLTLSCAQTMFTPENVSKDLSTMDTTQQFSTTSSVLQQWKDWEKSAEKRARDIVQWILPMVMEESSTGINITGPCLRDGMKLMAGIRRIKTWAFRFIDASGKTVDGMVSGTTSALGDYDQCVATEAIDERRGRNGQVMFTGKYCSIDIKPPIPPKKHFFKLSDTIEELRNFSKGTTMIREAAKLAHMFYFLSIRYGICVPSSCQESDIQQIANRVTERTNLILKVRGCELKEEREYTLVIIAVMVVSSFLGLLVLIGSIIDVCYLYAGRKIKGILLEILVAFSFVSNFKRLVNTDVSNENLSCLCGIRVLSITWIVLAHTYLNINYQMFQHFTSALDYVKDFAFNAVTNATVAVDSFFVMGGFLVCYLTFKVLEETKKPFNIFLYIVHRLIRILPLYMIVVASVFLTPLFGYGPIWHETMDNLVTPCYTYWWANFLFISNYLQPDQMCLPHSWYVASDMQIYVGALMILLPLLRWPKIGVSVAIFWILASIIASGTITYVMDLPPTMLAIHPDPEQRFERLSSYLQPYPHIAPYCIGILLGYLLFIQPKRQLSMNTRIIGWCSAIACNLAVLYGVHGWNSGRDLTLLETIIYSSCHRPAWALGVSWVIYNCVNGQGGVVNYILSWKCWVVLARLTYGVYLIHPIVQFTTLGNIRTLLQPSHFFAVWVYFGYLAASYGCAFVATMLVEAPFSALEKLLFRGQIEKTRKESTINDVFEIDGNARNSESKHTTVQDHKEHPAVENGIKNKSFLDDHDQVSRV